MSLALRFLGVAGRDGTHPAVADTSMKPSTGQRRGSQQKVWSVAQDRGYTAGKKLSTCGPCTDTMGTSEAHCLFGVVVRNWAGLESSFEEVNSGCRQSRQLEQDLALGCNGAGLALDWALGACFFFELVRNSAVSVGELLDSGPRDGCSQLLLAAACLRCSAYHT